MKTSTLETRMAWSFFMLLILFASCESDADRKARCRDQYNKCMDLCRKQSRDNINRHHTNLLGCSDKLISALNACDASHATNSKQWSSCMITATAEYQKCERMFELEYEIATLEVSICEDEC